MASQVQSYGTLDFSQKALVSLLALFAWMGGSVPEDGHRSRLRASSVELSTFGHSRSVRFTFGCRPAASSTTGLAPAFSFAD
jgi:hypothetical protein